MVRKDKRPHLGRGLASLLGPVRHASTEEAEVATVPSDRGGFPADPKLHNFAKTVNLSQLRPNPYQPRTTWDDESLDDLAASIKANGIIQPILVRQADDGYEIIAGERRFRAAQLAGLTETQVILRQANNEEMLELALVENIHRTDLNPIEKALAYQRYISTFNVTQSEASQKLGQDRSAISNYMRLLDLPQEVKQMLIDGQLNMGHARAILSLPTDAIRRKFANRALAGRLSVREVERLVRLSVEGARVSKPTVEKPSHILDLEQQLRDILGTKVRIDAAKRGNRGRIVIDYYSLDEFDRLTQKMGMAATESV